MSGSRSEAARRREFGGISAVTADRLTPNDVGLSAGFRRRNTRPARKKSRSCRRGNHLVTWLEQGRDVQASSECLRAG